MTNIAPSDRNDNVYYINGQLVLKNKNTLVNTHADGVELTGTTTVTLAF